MAGRQACGTVRAIAAGLLVLCTFPMLAPALTQAEGGKVGPAQGDGGKQIAGWVERIVMGSPEIVTLAKLDTGAKTSSIHAEDIERFEREGERWVRYTLVLKQSKSKVHRLPGESPLVRKVFIKDHASRPDARPVVELEFCMDGRRHAAHFSLIDRSAFLYSVLLGRDFLAGSFVVDPDETFLTRVGCKPESDAP